jgi:hypothetical protein
VSSQKFIEEATVGCCATHSKYGEVYLVGKVEHSGYGNVWIVEDSEEEFRLVLESALSDFFFWE